MSANNDLKRCIEYNLIDMQENISFDSTQGKDNSQLHLEDNPAVETRKAGISSHNNGLIPIPLSRTLSLIGMKPLIERSLVFEQRI